jgi:small-conductance mechanosensitive channel
MAAENESDDEPAGAISEHEARLVDRNARSTDADRDLDAIVKGAHDSMLNFRGRLSRISEEIDQRAGTPESATTDTRMGTTELHQFLLAKQAQIEAILLEAQADASTRRAQIARLNYPDTHSH